MYKWAVCLRIESEIMQRGGISFGKMLHIKLGKGGGPIEVTALWLNVQSLYEFEDRSLEKKTESHV